MVNYNKSTIYKLCCKDPEVKDEYIGSTTNFKLRKHGHKYACTNETHKKYHLKVYKCIRDNGNWDNWNMVEVEKYAATDKQDLHKRERYWIETLKTTLNKVIPTQTDKEYRDNNKEKKAEYREKNKGKIAEKYKEYYEENKDKILDNKKEYYEKNKHKIAEKNKKKASLNLINSKNPITMFWDEQSEFEFVDNIKKRIKKVDIWKSFLVTNGSKVLGRNKFYEMFMDIYKKELLTTTYNEGKEWSGIQRVCHQVNDRDEYVDGFPLM